MTSFAPRLVTDLPWQKRDTVRHLLSLTDVGTENLSLLDRFMEGFSRNEGTIFMHDLPAVRGDDVVNEVLDGP